MPPARTIRGRSARSWRVATAVIALYGLVLQALLGGIAALPDANASGVLCIGGADGVAAPGQPQPEHHTAACCTTPQAAATMRPPDAASAVVWPQRAFVRLIWRADGVALARAPPGTIASARAPPVA